MGGGAFRTQTYAHRIYQHLPRENQTIEPSGWTLLIAFLRNILIYHESNPFEVHSSVVLSKFTQLCSYITILFNILSLANETQCPLTVMPHSSLSVFSGPNNPQILCVGILPMLDILYKQNDTTCNLKKKLAYFTQLNAFKSHML